MKKEFNKKLTLNKKTITNLNPVDLGAVKGGVTVDTDITCKFCDTLLFSCEVTMCPRCFPSFFCTQEDTECGC